MESVRQHLGAITLFGSPAPFIALAVLLVVDLGLTFVHVAEEYKGRLWTYFGAITGVEIPKWVGVVFFTVILTVLLWAVGLAGIAGIIPFPHTAPDELWSVAAVGILIGGRL